MEKEFKAHAAVVDEDKFRVGNVGVRAGVDDDCVIPQVGASAEAGLFKGMVPEEDAEFNVGRAKAKAWVNPVGVGVEASANLIEAKAHGVDAKVGLSASTGVGVRDDSVKVQLLGTGVTVGRKIGIGIGGTGVSVDLGKIFKF